MEWRIWITWWIKFSIRYSRLFSIYRKKHGEKTDNSSIRVYLNKIKIRITFKTKIGFYLELLTPETMKFLGSTKGKINRNKNSKNVPHLEITEVVLTLFRMNLFGAACRMEKRSPHPKICHIYPTMMKIGTPIPYEKRGSKKYINHVTYSLSPGDILFCILSPEISKFCYIKEYRYPLHFDT